MDWCDEALARFCRELGVAVPSSLGPLIHLEFEQIGTLQLERHDRSLTLWLEVQLPPYAVRQAAHRALSLAYSDFAPPLPLRCGWVGECGLLLFITLDEWRVTLQVLQQAFRTLMATRSEVLSA